MRTVALANQKGGVGKTTTAVHLAHGLALAQQSVVLIDLDPQANATLTVQSMAIDAPDRIDPDSPRTALQPLRDGLWVLPSPGVHRNIERDQKPDTVRLRALCSELAEDGFDWLIVDCPPRMDEWGWAGLELGREVILPVQSEFLALHGLSQMMRTLAAARRTDPGHGELLGILPTMVDTREAVALDVLEDLRRNLGDDVFDTVIFRDPRFVEAASHGRTLFEYCLDSKGARAYGELVREILYGRA